MDRQAWLQKGRQLNNEISELLSAKKLAQEAAEHCTSHFGGERVSKTRKNSTDEKFINVAELSIKIDEKVKELTLRKSEMLDTIYKIDDARLRTLLIARYVNSKSWSEVAEQLNMSEKWARTRLHNEAVAALERIKL